MKEQQDLKSLHQQQHVNSNEKKSKKRSLSDLDEKDVMQEFEREQLLSEKLELMDEQEREEQLRIQRKVEKLRSMQERSQMMVKKYMKI